MWRASSVQWTRARGSCDDWFREVSGIRCVHARISIPLLQSLLNYCHSVAQLLGFRFEPTGYSQGVAATGCRKLEVSVSVTCVKWDDLPCTYATRGLQSRLGKECWSASASTCHFGQDFKHKYRDFHLNFTFFFRWNAFSISTRLQVLGARPLYARCMHEAMNTA